MASNSEPTRSHFNEVATGKDFASYEERRWSANPKQEAQRVATETFVTQIAVPLVAGATHIVELGAGPGTWTKYLREAAPEARFTLTDIAGEMLARARATFPPSATVAVVEANFTDAALPVGDADFFFSSRAIEYISPKDKMAEKIASVLRSGGAGALVTKMPKRMLNKLLGRKVPALHSGQMRPHDLVAYLTHAGLSDIHLYPVTFSFPIVRSAALDRILANMFAARPLNPVAAFFAESYGVTFRKP